jgi:putative transposase
VVARAASCPIDDDDGNCWDNAPTESLFNSLKNERVHGTSYPTRADAQADLVEYIEVFYNRSRRRSTLGCSCVALMPEAAAASRIGRVPPAKRTGEPIVSMTGLYRSQGSPTE